MQYTSQPWRKEVPGQSPWTSCFDCQATSAWVLHTGAVGAWAGEGEDWPEGGHTHGLLLFFFFFLIFIRV